MTSMGFITQEKKKETRTDAIVPINFTHAHAIGQTGCGKTTSFIYPNLAYRIKNKHSILLYDFKGKEHLALKYFAHKYDRENDLIEIGKPWGMKTNLIRIMSPNTLESFVETMIGSDAKDPYWPKSATKLFINVYNVVKILEKIYTSLTINADKNSFLEVLNFDEDLEHNDFVYPNKLSFHSVLFIAQSEESLAAFVSHLSGLTQNIERFFYQCLDNQDKQYAQAALIKKYAKPIKHFMQYKKIVKTTKKRLESYAKVNGENPKISIIMNLLPLNIIANDLTLNTDECNIIDALNEGALISINSRDMSDEFTQGLNKAIFSELSKRSLLSNVQPVSIFIDEAQRIMNKDSDYHLDVLRECKVELFLAYQNAELMKDKLGELKYKALQQNLSSSFYFRNDENSQDFQTSLLQDFESFSSKNSYEKPMVFKPMFLKKETLLQAEQSYLKKQEVYKIFQLEKYEKSCIVIYDKLNFEEDKVILYSIKTDKSSLVPVTNRSHSLAVFDFAKEMYNKAQNDSIKTPNF